MTRRRPPAPPRRRALGTVIGTVIGAALLATSLTGLTGCSEDGAGPSDGAAPSTTPTIAPSTAPSTAPTASPTTITPGEVTPPELLGHLLEAAPGVAARVDYNTGAGTIAVNYVGTQTVVLSTAGTWGDLALAACEAAARYARAIDAGAAIEVRDGMPGDARTPVRATLRPGAERCTRP